MLEVHFAISNYTACMTHIVGSTVDCRFDKPNEQILTGQGYNIQHTCIPEKVTCKKCIESKTFKDYKND